MNARLVLLEETSICASAAKRLVQRILTGFSAPKGKLRV